MREIIIGDRTIAIIPDETEATEYGDIQRFRVSVSGSDATTRLSCLRSDSFTIARHENLHRSCVDEDLFPRADTLAR